MYRFPLSDPGNHIAGQTTILRRRAVTSLTRTPTIPGIPTLQNKAKLQAHVIALEPYESPAKEAVSLPYRWENKLWEEISHLHQVAHPKGRVSLDCCFNNSEGMPVPGTCHQSDMIWYYLFPRSGSLQFPNLPGIPPRQWPLNVPQICAKHKWPKSSRHFLLKLEQLWGKRRGDRAALAEMRWLMNQTDWL